jgi:hypothetical protein
LASEWTQATIPKARGSTPVDSSWTSSRVHVPENVNPIPDSNFGNRIPCPARCRLAAAGRCCVRCEDGAMLVWPSFGHACRGLALNSRRSLVIRMPALGHLLRLGQACSKRRRGRELRRGAHGRGPTCLPGQLTFNLNFLQRHRPRHDHAAPGHKRGVLLGIHQSGWYLSRLDLAVALASEKVGGGCGDDV